MQMESKRKLKWQFSYDKIDLKIKKITRNKEGHYIMIKGSIQEEDITIVNIYAPNTGAPQYIRQTLTERKESIAEYLKQKNESVSWKIKWWK